MNREKEFQIIPGVGEKLSKSIVELGYTKVTDLVDESPEDMYQKLIEIQGKHIDRCRQSD